MHYSDNALWRPLFDQTEAMLQVAQGCSYSKCRFCIMCKESSFALSPEEEMREDIAEITRFSWKESERVFLTGGNAFRLPTRRLRKTVETFGKRRVRNPLLQDICEWAGLRTREAAEKTPAHCKRCDFTK